MGQLPVRTPWIQGTAVAPGLAFGGVHVVRAGADDVPEWTVRGPEVPAEIGRLASALTAASEELEHSRRIVASSAGEKDAEIFAAHRLILQDPGALQAVERTIADERINAEAAVQRLIERLEESMGGLEAANVRGFASDVSDPWRRVLDKLLQRDREEIEQTQEKVVLAGAELTPKVVTFLERERVLAVVCGKGGRFSHGAVLARSFGVPCVVGLPNLLARLEQGMPVAVDGDTGKVWLKPDRTELDGFIERKRLREAREEQLQAEAALPAQTPDGTRLGIQVNIESVRDFDTFDVSTSDGVGLLRTEFLYMERNQFPSEEEQFRLYRRVMEQLDGRPATFRVLDVGGDKPLPYFKTPPETNPALGWRGLRVTLQWRDLLRVQLRALLRASSLGDLRILLPMVTSVSEIREVHATFDEVRRDLRTHGYRVDSDVPVGSMIEVPSALIELDRISRYVDFVSLGTNDLVQYLLAADRDNTLVAQYYDPQHPAILRALAQAAATARDCGTPCSVCGEMAGDPSIAIILLGMGYTSVSVSPNFVPEIKYAVRRTTQADAAEFAEDALARETADEVREVLERVREHLYGGVSEGTDDAGG